MTSTIHLLLTTLHIFNLVEISKKQDLDLKAESLSLVLSLKSAPILWVTQLSCNIVSTKITFVAQRQVNSNNK